LDAGREERDEFCYSDDELRKKAFFFEKRTKKLLFLRDAQHRGPNP
jgi:hypothetical protein